MSNREFYNANYSFHLSLDYLCNHIYTVKGSKYNNTGFMVTFLQRPVLKNKSGKRK